LTACLGETERDGAGGGAEIVDLDRGGDVVTGEEALQDRLPDAAEPVDAGAQVDGDAAVGGFDEHLEVASELGEIRYGVARPACCARSSFLPAGSCVSWTARYRKTGDSPGPSTLPLSE
jgi:hypothetical protein